MTNQTRLRADFVEAMSRAAFTVSIAATNGPAGKAGLTVSAMTSVSADPPSILVCVNQGSQFAECIRGNGHFGVSILGADQEELADCFAGRGSVEDRFSIGEWSKSGNDVPFLANAAISFECALMDCKTVGTHYVVIGLVGVVHMSKPIKVPLVHHQRRYGFPWFSSTMVSSS